MRSYMKTGRVVLGVMLCAGMGASLLLAQSATGGKGKDSNAAVQAMLQKMDAQVDVPEVPVAQRASREQVDKMFEAMRFHDQLSKVADMTTAGMQGMVQQIADEQKKEHPNEPAMTAAQEKQLEALMTEFTKKVIAVIDSEEVLGGMKETYRRYLTVDDVNGIIAFYQSPAGQHLLDKQTKIQLQAMPAMMQVLQKKIEELTVEMLPKIEALKLPSKKASAKK